MSPLVALLSLCAGAPAAAAPQVELLAGQMELIVLPVAGATSASLRYVVRSGAAHDPPAKGGLAHLVEHMLIRDAKGAVGLIEVARAAGARVDAYTSRDATVFELDAPAKEFEALARALIRAVNDPAFRSRDIDRELGVIQNEAELPARGGQALRYIDKALFRGQGGGTVIGSSAARATIERSDLVAFYQRHYVTSNTTAVLTGAVTPASARALLDESLLLPPALPGERPEPILAIPELPFTESVRAPFLGAVMGYRVETADHEACLALAALVELRLYVALQLREPLVSSVSVECADIRGSRFVLAVAYSPGVDASDLSETMTQAFRDAGRMAPTSQERKVLEQRLRRIAERVQSDPAALADDVAWNASQPREGTRTVLPRARVGPFPAVQELARRAFTPERRVLLQLSPFSG
ncbi:MAG: insulinase family protein [Deltaproteobacteria bacterium]|nr:insulinase family protein [Deltaproteobacteria bacterium]